VPAHLPPRQPLVDLVLAVPAAAASQATPTVNHRAERRHVAMANNLPGGRSALGNDRALP
jgi:hypothetical protein